MKQLAPGTPEHTQVKAQFDAEIAKRKAFLDNLQKEHPNSFLSYAFLNVAKEITDDWQIGYYNKETNKITTFTIIATKSKLKSGNQY